MRTQGKWRSGRRKVQSEIKGAVRPFTVAMDYDDTFTTCPETWTRVFIVLREAGADVVCVTSRRPDMPVTDFPGRVVYCSGRPKAEVAREHGYEIKVWIDDQPEYIGVNPERLFLKQLAGVL
jgi:hypothetical protein